MSMQNVKAPFSMQRSPLNKTPVGISPFDFALGLESVRQVAKDLEELKKEQEKDHKNVLRKMQENYAQKLAEIDGHIQKMYEYVATIEAEPGEKGETGETPVVDIEAIAKKAAKLVPVPEIQVPTVDVEAIAKKAAKLIKVPESKTVVTTKIEKADHKEIIDTLVKKIREDKVLGIEHISNFTDGLEQTIRPIRSLAAGFRGGGDVVTAGSNITITTLPSGQKQIASTGGGGGGGSGYQAATGTVDGSNTIFVFATEPTAISVDGQSLQKTSSDGTVNWTGTTTITLTVAPNRDIFGTAAVGGSGYQAATGTVDGSNTIFGFTSAPSAIMVDGQPLQKTASDGTVNWTGTTTITLSVAPTRDIFAVA